MMMLQIIVLSLTFLREDDFSLSLDSIVTMLSLNMELFKVIYLDQPILIHIIDLNHVIKRQVHQFEDDINPTNLNSSINKLDIFFNLDMKHLSVWLNINNAFLNAPNTALKIFFFKRKKSSHQLNIKLSRK